MIKDSVHGGWVERMPAWARPCLRLARYDRPVGFWLLGLPGLIGLAFAAQSHGFAPADAKWAALLMIGAIAMRGAGCTYNDIIDRDLDSKVERTALRPLPAGSISLRGAWGWLALQCAVGAGILLTLPQPAQMTALAAIPMVAAYPFMKRITWWPQAWLGLTFNWAVLVAYVIKTGHISPGLITLYLGLALWTIGYDTIYAMEDTEDDALIGVRSTARLFGAHMRTAVAGFYAGSCVLITAALYLETVYDFAWLAVFPIAAHFIWQIKRAGKNAAYLAIFKSNVSAGLILALSIAVQPILMP